jgi:hypothetical protein
MRASPDAAPLQGGQHAARAQPLRAGQAEALCRSRARRTLQAGGHRRRAARTRRRGSRAARAPPPQQASALSAAATWRLRRARRPAALQVDCLATMGWCCAAQSALSSRCCARHGWRARALLQGARCCLGEDKASAAQRWLQQSCRRALRTCAHWPEQLAA